jgi:hypothetical protein
MFSKSILAFGSLIALSAATIAPMGPAFADDAQISTSATTESAPAPTPVSTPATGKGQALMQGVLDDLVQGKTELVQLQPMARVNLLQQPGMLASLSMRLQSFGTLQSVSYAGMQNGMEIYDVRFASASMLFAAAIAPDGKIARIQWKFH